LKVKTTHYETDYKPLFISFLMSYNPLVAHLFNDLDAPARLAHNIQTRGHILERMFDFSSIPSYVLKSLASWTRA
jgi:hypothetical protein